MLYIEKETCPSEVADDIERVIHEKYDLWDRISEPPLPGEAKPLREEFFKQLDSNQVRHFLLREQHGLCAYCMAKIQNNSSTIIEHLYPLSKSKQRSMDYANWVATCDGGQARRKEAAGEGIRQLPACCDNKKGDHESTLSPLDREQMEKIIYREDGLIFYFDPKAPDQARIIRREIDEIFGLNGTYSLSGKLSKKGGFDTATGVVKGRRDAYKAINNDITLWRENLLSGALSPEDIRSIVEETIADLTPPGNWQEFVGVQLYALRQFLELEVP